MEQAKIQLKKWLTLAGLTCNWVLKPVNFCPGDINTNTFRTLSLRTVSFDDQGIFARYQFGAIHIADSTDGKVTNQASVRPNLRYSAIYTCPRLMCAHCTIVMPCRVARSMHAS